VAKGVSNLNGLPTTDVDRPVAVVEDALDLQESGDLLGAPVQAQVALEDSSGLERDAGVASRA